MPQKIHPGVVAAIIVVVVIVIAFIAWRMFAPPAHPSAGVLNLRRSTVIRGPNGSLQFSPEAQAQRGPRR